MGTADTGDGALVAQQRMELPALGAQDFPERRGVEIERIRSQVRKSLVQGIRRDEPDPARFFFPPSVSTSSAPPSKRRRNIGAFGFFALAARNRSRPALIKWMRRTRSSPSTGKRRFLPRRSAPSKRLPSSAESGGSNVFSVAMCAGPACSIGGSRNERVELAHPGLDLR